MANSMQICIVFLLGFTILAAQGAPTFTARPRTATFRTKTATFRSTSRPSSTTLRYPTKRIVSPSRSISKLTPTTTAAKPTPTPFPFYGNGSFPQYDVGSPVLTTIWVSPSVGDDILNTGLTRQSPLKSLAEAWRRIPPATRLDTIGHGFNVLLLEGSYTDLVPVYMEQRWGTFKYPIFIRSADGAGKAVLPNLNIFNCTYLYLIGLRLVQGGGDVLHLEQGHHVLLRGLTIVGTGVIESYNCPQETLKVNQLQHIYVEACDISGAWDNAIDMVAVQYGHVVRSKIHRAGDWCMYLKGGSAYFWVMNNEFFDCGTGGFTAGQGTGFEFMTPPWLHYETYDVKFVRNLIRNTAGAAWGVNGGYNILIAYNTAYNVGTRSHVVEVTFGSRSCDGDVITCQRHRTLGGWGAISTAYESAVPIPSRNTYIHNNLIVNIPPVKSQWQHFEIPGPRPAIPGSNVPSPETVDENLRIAGNIIFNGGGEMPLGLGESTGCRPTNPTCNAAQLVSANRINTLLPQFVNAAAFDFRLVRSSPLCMSITTYASAVIPNFPGNDRPAFPKSPSWILENNGVRTVGPIGAFGCA